MTFKEKYILVKLTGGCTSLFGLKGDKEHKKSSSSNFQLYGMTDTLDDFHH